MPVSTLGADSYCFLDINLIWYLVCHPSATETAYSPGFFTLRQILNMISCDCLPGLFYHPDLIIMSLLRMPHLFSVWIMLPNPLFYPCPSVFAGSDPGTGTTDQLLAQPALLTLWISFQPR